MDTLFTDPRGSTESFLYDRSGNLAVWTNRRGQAVSYTYDALNRPLTRLLPGNDTTHYAYHRNYGYDSAWVAVRNRASSDTAYSFLAPAVLRQASARHGATYALSTTYDGAGQVTSLKLDNNPVITNLWKYAGGRLDSI